MSGLLFSGCVHRWIIPAYPSIVVKVVDADSGAPVDNAVVVCVWWNTEGLLPGLTSTKTYRVTEGLTDSQGRYLVPGMRSSNPRILPPILTVYKRGYAAWNSREIFPDRRKRTDFHWGDGEMLRMEKWEDKYSHVEHVDYFISLWTHDAVDKGLFLLNEAMAWESKLTNGERNKINENRLLRNGGGQ
jgi:hypothetical protein